MTSSLLHNSKLAKVSVFCLYQCIYTIEIASMPSKSLWRNGLAHWTSNSKVPGSSPGRDVPSFFNDNCPVTHFLTSNTIYFSISVYVTV